MTASKVRKTMVSVVAIVGVVVASGVAFAGDDGDRDHHRSSVAEGAPQPMLVGQTTGGVCRMGYDTQLNSLTPPDDSTGDNPPAGSVNLRKTCQGAVVGTFVAEVTTGSGYLHLDMRATCTGTGGMTGACTVGQQVLASPGHTFLKNEPAVGETQSMTMVWTGLKKGLWRFDALVGGINGASVMFRTFTVEAYNGG